MAENAGIFGWTDINKHAVYLADRQIGDGGDLSLDLPIEGGPAGSGVPTPSGVVHQTSFPSPKASTGAFYRRTMTLRFTPHLDRATYEYVGALPHHALHNLPPLWIPFPRIETWRIRADGRTNWTLAGQISGSGGARGLHITPKVFVKSTAGSVTHTTEAGDYPAATALSLVTGAPAGGQVKILTATDTDQVVTGDDFTAQAGGHLEIHYFGFVPVQILGVSSSFSAIGELASDIQVLESPAQKDYEADA